MRKADYQVLAAVIREQRETIQKMETADSRAYCKGAQTTAELIARNFSNLASVDRAKFLAECGIADCF